MGSSGTLSASTSSLTSLTTSKSGRPRYTPATVWKAWSREATSATRASEYKDTSRKGAKTQRKEDSLSSCSSFAPLREVFFLREVVDEAAAAGLDPLEERQDQVLGRVGRQPVGDRPDGIVRAEQVAC